MAEEESGEGRRKTHIVFLLYSCGRLKEDNYLHCATMTSTLNKHKLVNKKMIKMFINKFFVLRSNAQAFN
jgi:hypothetical protein